MLEDSLIDRMRCLIMSFINFVSNFSISHTKKEKNAASINFLTNDLFSNRNDFWEVVISTFLTFWNKQCKECYENETSLRLYVVIKKGIAMYVKLVWQLHFIPSKSLIISLLILHVVNSRNKVIKINRTLTFCIIVNCSNALQFWQVI